MDVQQWAAQEISVAGPCPSCGAQSPRPVFYGMPDYVTYRSLEAVVDFAGCCEPDIAHRWTCGRCGTAYGLPDLGADG